MSVYVCCMFYVYVYLCVYNKFYYFNIYVFISCCLTGRHHKDRVRKTCPSKGAHSPLSQHNRTHRRYCHLASTNYTTDMCCHLVNLFGITTFGLVFLVYCQLQNIVLFRLSVLMLENEIIYLLEREQRNRNLIVVDISTGLL